MYSEYIPWISYNTCSNDENVLGDTVRIRKILFYLNINIFERFLTDIAKNMNWEKQNKIHIFHAEGLIDDRK